MTNQQLTDIKQGYDVLSVLTFLFIAIALVLFILAPILSSYAAILFAYFFTAIASACAVITSIYAKEQLALLNQEIYKIH